MTMKTILKTTGLVLCLAALSACASTKKDTGTETVTETVTPMEVQSAGPTQGFEPGTQADLENNVGHRVFFGYDQYNLTPAAQEILARQAAFLKEYPESRLRMEGNCDERGTREYNLALGARRANAAKAYLSSLGIDPSRVTTISYGKERPIDGGSNPSSWARNRNATSTLVAVGS